MSNGFLSQDEINSLLNGELNNDIIEKIKQIPDIYFVRNIFKLEN